ncbi:hypothetical protein NECID01_1002 [Nematocida sp. AWRm77]|nr:hypothetical protein NECID01_1002 [Nematocida sp. AWRm77]
MRKIAAIFILTSLAAVCGSQVEVDLTLRNSDAAIRVAVPQGAFQVIDRQAYLYYSDSDDGAPSPKKAKIEDNIRVALCEFENKAEYEQFRKLWDTSIPALFGESSIPSQEETSLTADLFEKCLLTANYLDIQGDYAARFAENIVKHGLLGKHSADIVSLEFFSTRDLSHDTFWTLLYAFLAQAGFEYRIAHPSRGQTVLWIESTNPPHPKQIDEEYTGPSQTASIRSVLYSKLGPIGTQEKKRNEDVLGWLLLNIGGASVDIQYFMTVSSEDIFEHSQTIQNLSKKDKKGACVYVEGVSLNLKYSSNFSLLPSLQLVPDLSRLELFINIDCDYVSNEELSSLFSGISSCKSLKALEIREKRLESVVVGKLMESIPTIEQLCLFCNILEATAIDNLKKCTYLEKLKIYGEDQPPSVLQSLITHLFSLKDLRIICDDLEPAVVNTFEVGAQLEKLEIWGCYQPSRGVEALVSRLSSLKELSIGCKSLDAIAAESFQACKHLEKLEIYGDPHPSTAVKVLVSHLSSIRELIIRCSALDPADAESFQACTQLEKLKIYGEYYQPSSAVQVLVSHLSSLKELNIEYQPLDPADAESFQACKKLEKLVIFGEGKASFLIKLLGVLPSLQELRIELDIADLALAIALRKCPNLRFLMLTVSQYTPGFLVAYLQDPLPSLTYLEVLNLDRNNQYSEEDNKAAEKTHEIRIFT